MPTSPMGTISEWLGLLSFGNGGGGKSTFARALAERHDLVCCCLLGNL